MAAKISYSSNLIENYKEMSFLSAEKQILGMCGDEGNRVFSIGDDGELNLFCEQNGSETGWNRFVLSDGIKQQVGCDTLSIKQFCAKKRNDKFHVVAIANYSGKDELFFSQTAEPTQPDWKKIAFDDPSIEPKGIGSVFSSELGEEFEIIADVVTPSGFVERYFVDCNDELGGNQKWHKHSLAANFEKTEMSCMGMKKNASVPGIYTFGVQGTVQMVIYTPIYNEVDPESQPNPVRIVLPTKMDTITTQTTEDGYTNLFICGSGQLFISAYDKQKDYSEPVCVVKSDLFNKVKELYAYRIPALGIVRVWGYNEDQKVFYCYCKEDCLENPECWSEAFVQMNEAIYFNTYYNELSKNCTSIAYTQDKMVKLGVQSLETSVWSYKNIGLPSEDEVKKFNSYATRILLKDETGNALSNKEVWLEGKDYYSVYINNVYHTLDKGEPIKVKTDSSGTIRIVYQTDSIYSKEFYIYENKDANDNEKTEVKAWEKTVDKLLALDTKEQIREAQIVYGNGANKPLVDTSLPECDLNAVAETMKKMAEVKRDMVTPPSMRAIGAPAHRGLFVTFDSGNTRVVSGENALREALRLNMVKGATIMPDGTLQIERISVVSGTADGVDFISDVVNFIKNIGKKIWSYFVDLFEDGWHFVIKIGEKVLNFIIDCVDAIVAGLEIIWDAIKVTMKELVEYLSFVFNWKDIKNTANIVEHLFTLNMDYTRYIIDELKFDLEEFTDEMTNAIDKWANIEHIDGIDQNSIAEIKDSSPQIDINSVECSFLTDHLIQNLPYCKFELSMQNSIGAEIDESSWDEFIKKEEIILKEVYRRLEMELPPNIGEMSFIDLTKKVIAIITVGVVKSIETGIELILDVIKDFIELMRKFFCTEIRIPVVNDILEEWFDIKSFSVLDILSYVIAVPSTIGYKIITEEPMFNEEQYRRIMDIEMPKGNIGFLDFPDIIPNEDKNTVYVLGHITGGCARLIEIGIFPLSSSAEEGDLLLGKVDVVFSILAAGLDALGDVAYTPYFTNTPLKVIHYITLLPLVGVIVGTIKKNKTIEKGSKIAYAIGSLVDAIVNIILIVYTSTKKNPPERAIGNIELVYNFLSDLGTSMDQAILYVEDPETKTILLVIREILVGGGEVLNIISGIKVRAEKLPKLT